MITPIFTPLEQKTQAVFAALMWSLSRPGQIRTLPDTAAAYPDNFIAIGDTLLDLETSFYTPNATLGHALSRTTARPEQPDRAAYHFYPTFDETQLDALAQAAIGTMLYPDQAAIIILSAKLDQGFLLELTGPGIQAKADIRVGGLPEQIWTLREQKRRYPLGWDMFLVDDTRVIGLPRTTYIEVRSR
jgi:alpha-D-ribose 1-methylphosphonate 5-triphosphate synthase subunit PhnH